MFYLSEKICLIIPCYNETERLDFKKFEKANSNCYFLFVNDGSKDGTLDMLKENIKENMYIMNLDKNLGKGEAVRRGMLFLKTLPIFQHIQWVGYWDADLATPLSELNNFILYSRMFDGKIDAIWGSRICKMGSNIKRSYKRHLLSRLFATEVGFILGVNCYDSQCGAKLFKKELLDVLFSEPFISKWIFDVEIFLRMRLNNYKIIEYPLQSWTDISRSKVKVSTLALRILLDIIKIRKKLNV